MRYDAIVVLGAVMVWDKSGQKWTFPDIVPGYAGKLVIGEKRALAAVHVADQTDKLLVTGGSQSHPETGEIHSRATELAKLIISLGVDQAKVEVIGTTGMSHTQGNVENVVVHLKANTNIRRVAILSPLFQHIRAKMMFDGNPFFKENGIDLYWLLVEAILGIVDRKYIEWSKRLYSSPEAATCLKMEQKGIYALCTGQYKPKS